MSTEHTHKLSFSPFVCFLLFFGELRDFGLPFQCDSEQRRHVCLHPLNGLRDNACEKEKRERREKEERKKREKREEKREREICVVPERWLRGPSLLSPKVWK